MTGERARTESTRALLPTLPRSRRCACSINFFRGSVCICDHCRTGRGRCAPLWARSGEWADEVRHLKRIAVPQTLNGQGRQSVARGKEASLARSRFVTQLQAMARRLVRSMREVELAGP